MNIVEKSNGQFHILLIVADGQVDFSYFSAFNLFLSRQSKRIHFVAKVTRGSSVGDGELSVQEEKTIKAIVDAR